MTAERDRRRASVSAEARRLAADPVYVVEARAVAALMAQLLVRRDLRSATGRTGERR
jgi:hypothetical protein